MSSSTAKSPHRWRKVGHFRLPADGEPIKTRWLGPFLIEVVHRWRDGRTRLWNSRAYRKGFAPRLLPRHGEETSAPRTPRLFLLSPKQLNWWISVLFMIGALHFVAGSVMALGELVSSFTNNLTYFIGSLFFTSAAYIQHFQAINADRFVAGGSGGAAGKRWLAWQPERIDFWVTITQFVGTILFNFNTFNPFWTQGTVQEDLFVWIPNIEGSILFMISGTLAMMEICHGWCWRFRDLEWWLTFINFLGCVAFLLSALLAFANPHPIWENKTVWSNAFTLIGAVCFFVGAYLMLPEMSARAPALSDDLEPA
jgi:hypothetical protein